MTASQQAASRVLLDIDQAARQVLAVESALLLEGARPRLLDEWQVTPERWKPVCPVGPCRCGSCSTGRRRAWWIPASACRISVG